MKLGSALLLILAETLCIYAELYMASLAFKTLNISKLIVPILLVIFGSLGLLAGYYYLYKLYTSVWVPSVVSLGAIFISEPILVYLMFKEVPSPKIIVSMILMIIGITITLK